MEEELLNYLTPHIFINDLANVILNYIQPCKFCYYIDRKLDTVGRWRCAMDTNRIIFNTKNEIIMFKMNDKLYLKFPNDYDYETFLKMDDLFGGNNKLDHKVKIVLDQLMSCLAHIVANIKFMVM